MIPVKSTQNDDYENYRDMLGDRVIIPQNHVKENCANTSVKLKEI